MFKRIIQINQNETLYGEETVPVILNPDDKLEVNPVQYDIL